MGHNGRVGAPSLLTDDLRARIERELATGATQATVAQRTGVTARSLKRWLADGKVVRRQLERAPAAPPPEPELPLPARLAQAEPGLVAALIQAAQRGHWQAAAWLLERSFPDRWARRDPTAPAGAADAFSELDELAARRRGR
jgi:hypothetical protein